MSRTFRQLRTARELEHCSQGSLGHKNDKELGDARRAEEWLLLPPKGGSEPKRDFSSLSGRDFVVDKGSISLATSNEFVAYLSRKRIELTRYRTHKKRGSKVAEATIKCLTPLVELVVNLAPWVSEFLSFGVSEAPKEVERAVERIAVQMIPRIEQETDAEVIGFTVHFDTENVHLNFILSRVKKDKKGVARLAVRRGFGLAGPWLTAVDRQRRIGLVYGPHDVKFERAMAKFQARYPGRRSPLDLMLASVADALSERIFGPMAAQKAGYRLQTEERRGTALQARKNELLGALRDLEPFVTPQSKSEKDLTYGRS